MWLYAAALFTLSDAFPSTIRKWIKQCLHAWNISLSSTTPQVPTYTPISSSLRTSFCLIRITVAYLDHAGTHSCRSSSSWLLGLYLRSCLDCSLHYGSIRRFSAAYAAAARVVGAIASTGTSANSSPRSKCARLQNPWPIGRGRIG